MRLFAALLFLILGACASAHSEFEKQLDDPQAFRERNQDKRVHTGRLPNGHVEEEYKVGFRSECRVFIEVDPQQGKAVKWRYNPAYSDLDCISPNVGK